MIDRLHQLPLLLGATIVCLIFVVPTLIGSVLLQPIVSLLLRGKRMQTRLSACS